MSILTYFMEIHFLKRRFLLSFLNNYTLYVDFFSFMGILFYLTYSSHNRMPKLSATEHKNADLHTFCTGTARDEAILRGNLRNALAEDQYMIEAP